LRCSLVILFVLAILMTVLVHAQEISIVPKKILYIFNVGKKENICAYVKYSGTSFETNVDLILHMSLPVSKVFKIELRNYEVKPNTEICIPLTLNETGLYYAVLSIGTAEGSVKKVIARVIAVHSPNDVIVGKNIVVFEIARPYAYSLETLYNIAEIVYNKYRSFGLVPAQDCLIGKRLIIAVSNLPEGTPSETYLVPSHCVYYIIVSPLVESLPLLKHAIAHEMFHTIQVRYEIAGYESDTISFFMHVWLIEGGADSAPYFVWGPSVERKALEYLFTSCWFTQCYGLTYSPTYMYDPAYLPLAVYYICIRSGGSPSTCFGRAYAYSYTYAPVVLYIFKKLGLNPATMRLLYSSYYPQDNPEVLEAIYEAYLTYARGYVFIDPQLRPSPYPVTNITSVIVFTRAVRYLDTYGIKSGRYIFSYTCNRSCYVQTYVYNSQTNRTEPLKNGSTIYVNSHTLLVLIGEVPEHVLKTNPLYSGYYNMTIIFKKYGRTYNRKYYLSIEPSNITLRVGEERRLNVYVEPGTGIRNMVLNVTIENSSVISLLNVKKAYNGETINCIESSHGETENLTCHIELNVPCKVNRCNILRLTIKGETPGSTSIIASGTVETNIGTLPTVPTSARVTVIGQKSSLANCVLVLKPRYSTVKVGHNDTVTLVLKNCTGAAGIIVSIYFNSTIAKVEKVLPGPFVNVTKSVFEAKISNDSVGIGAVGLRACKRASIDVAYIVFKMRNTGTLMLWGIGQVASPNGNEANLTVVPAEIKVIPRILECDFNHNNRLDVGDVVLLLRILIGAYHSNVPCDLNHNGKLDIGDAVLLLKKIVSS